MVNLIERVASTCCRGLIDAGVSIKKGCLFVAGEAGPTMSDIYSMEGFEKLSKALIADLKFFSLIPCIKGVFAECLATLEAQKDLYYATLFMGSMTEFIKIDPTSGAKSFQLPKFKEGPHKGKTDVVKILYAIGNFCEAGKFLQKFQVYSFALCTQVASRLGSMQVFTLYGQSWTVGDIPVLNCLCDKPKDFFIFIASGVEVWRCKEKNLLKWQNAFKLAGSTGKMLLIPFGRHHNKKVWFVVLDLVTQNASLFGFIVKRYKERQKRFNYPWRS